MALTPRELTDLSIKEVKDYFNSKGKVWTLHNFNISYYIMLCGAPCEVITFCDGRVESWFSDTAFHFEVNGSYLEVSIQEQKLRNNKKYYI